MLNKLAGRLAFWNARLLSREGRVLYIQAMLIASIVYQIRALDVDPWFIKAIYKLRRGFSWAGKEDAR
jgi:hypothetical protein